MLFVLFCGRTTHTVVLSMPCFLTFGLYDVDHSLLLLTSLQDDIDEGWEGDVEVFLVEYKIVIYRGVKSYPLSVLKFGGLQFYKLKKRVNYNKFYIATKLGTSQISTKCFLFLPLTPLISNIHSSGLELKVRDVKLYNLNF